MGSVKMKCKIKGLNDLSPKAKKELFDALAECNKEYLEKELERMNVVITSNLFKIFVVAANEQCGLGSSRLDRILNEVMCLVENMKDDNETLFLVLEKKCKEILSDTVYNLYFRDIPFKAMPDSLTPKIK